MKKTIFFVSSLCALLVCSSPVQAAPGSTNPFGLQLTLELRDGSRVVGKGLDDSLTFHSAALGDLQLSWAGIRSIEFAAGTNTARLTATNGDVFAVQVAAEAFRVETGFGQTEMPVKLIRSVKVAPPANPSAAAAGTARLAVELRDGSHVMGTGLDDTLSFHAAEIGDLKLAWSGIRSIEYAGPNPNLAQLTAANGDVYVIQFATPSIRVETSFGKTELPVKLIRSIRVSVAGRAGQLPSDLPAGLVALWPGDGSANDVAGQNNGTLNGGVTYANDDAGAAFRFDGSTGYVFVPHSPLWDFGSNPFTIAFWANFSSPGGEEALIADDNRAGSGENKWILFHGFQGAMYPRNMSGNSSLIFHIRGANSADIGNFPFSPVAGQWYHIAVTRNASTWTFYVNGAVIGTARVFISVPSMTAPLTIGNAEQLYFFNGLMRQVSIYNRALPAAEIQSIYDAGKTGK
jgi:hypothetical protein